MFHVRAARRVAARSRVASLALAVALLAGCGGGAAPMGRSLPAAGACHTGAHLAPGGLTPAQLAAAYEVTPLWRRGFRGQGRSVAVIEVGASLDTAAFRRFSACFGPYPQPLERLIGGGRRPPPGGEGIFDPEVVAAIAPRVRTYLIESAGDALPAVLPRLLAAALRPALTGGRLVSAISISFGLCEPAWPRAAIRATEVVLARAARLGVPVLAAAGNSGSASAYRAGGRRRCLPHAPVALRAYAHRALAGIGYPGSSPLVTAVGGTELAIDGAPRTGGAPRGGALTAERVWDEQVRPGVFLAGGGGASTLFSVADAPWQRAAGVRGAERKPDIAALAGPPGFPGGREGTSGAAPLVAGALAVLDGDLAAHGERLPRGPLNRLLYRLAARPATARRAFHDIVSGSNDILALGCCTARPGFDAASGLGSLDVAGLAQALLPARGRRSPPAAGPA